MSLDGQSIPNHLDKQVPIYVNLLIKDTRYCFQIIHLQDLFTQFFD